MSRNDPSEVESETVAHAIFRILEESGDGHLFTIPGGAVASLVDAAVQRGHHETVVTRQETGAAFMAMGYAQAGRRLGVCAVTAGPGATNAVTGVAAAKHDGVPLLLLSGQVTTDTFGRGAFQDSSSDGQLDVVGLFRHVTKRSVLLSDAAQVGGVTRRLIELAHEGRPGPVHLSVPANLGITPVPVATQQVTGLVRRASRTVDAQSIRDIAHLLAQARRPVILAGHGVQISGAWAELRAVAERFEVPVATTPKGKGAFAEDHPLAMGVFGFGGASRAESYLLEEKVDVLLVVGSSLGEFQTRSYHPGLTANRTVIQVDIDEDMVGRSYLVDLAVVADARVVLGALAESADQVEIEREPLAPPPERAVPEPTSGDRLPATAVVAAMSDALPADASLFVDIGNCMSWASQQHVVRRPGSYFVGLGLGSMGYAGPAAIGAMLAVPETPAVALLGDGAFAMTGMEIHTAVEYGVPVVWVVLNNGGHGMVHAGELLTFGESNPRNLFNRPMDVAAVAAGLGARSSTVETLPALRAALAEAFAAGEPTVIEVPVDPDEIPDVVRGRANDLFRRFGGGRAPAAHG